MNRNQLIVILAILAVLGGAGLVLMNQHTASWSKHEAKMGDNVLTGFDPNAVASIHIKGNFELNVVRNNGVWSVRERDNYPANFGQISAFLIKLKDLKVVEAETAAPSDLSHVNLEEPGKGSNSGTLIEFKDAQGKLLASILVGKQYVREKSETSRSVLMSGEPDGRYILLPDDPKTVMLISDPLGIVTPDPGAWMNRDFFKIEKPKSFVLTSPDGAILWKLSRDAEASAWSLADIKTNETMDAYRPTSLADTFLFPRFTDVVINTATNGTGLEKPSVLTIESFNHFTYALKIGAKTTDGDSYMTFAVAAEIPSERVAAKGEKPEDKDKLDKEFQSQRQQLQNRLKQQQSISSRVFKIDSHTMDLWTSARSEFIHEKAASAPTNSLDTGGWKPRVIQ